MREKLLSSWGIQDANNFYFGCFIPDIYVGWMVPDVSHKLDYYFVHMVDPGKDPMPQQEEYWDTYVVPAAQKARRASCASGNRSLSSLEKTPETFDNTAHSAHAGPTKPRSACNAAHTATPDDSDGASDPRLIADLVLGAWCHLTADSLYNHAFLKFMIENKIPRGEPTRIAKQGDFDLFGRSFSISHKLRLTDQLVHSAAHFPQYPIEAEDVRKTVDVVSHMVDRNKELHLDTPEQKYQMVPLELMQASFKKVHETLLLGLKEYAKLREEF